VYSWNYALKGAYYKKSYKLRHKDKKRLLTISGFRKLKRKSSKKRQLWVDVEGLNRQNRFDKMLKINLKQLKKFKIVYKKRFSLLKFNRDWKYDPKNKRFVHPYMFELYC
jgi:hypothetical protein